MKTCARHIIAAWLIVIGLCLLMPGCRSTPGPVRPLPDAAPLMQAQEGKDRSIAEWAAKIDAAVDAWLAQFPSPLAAEIKAATAGQRAAVLAAPASQFNTILAAYQHNAAESAKAIARLTRERDEARSLVDRVIRIGGYALAGILAAAAAASLFLAAQVPWLGPRISAALGAASVSIFAMVWAYEWTKQHPWITAITGACVLVAGALAYANHLHSKN